MFFSKVVCGGALVIAVALALSMRLLKTVRFGLVLDEHDSYFNLRVSQKMQTDGLSQTLEWFDSSTWYPYGRHIGQTILPGLMATAVAGHRVINTVFAVELETVCILLPAFLSAATVLAGSCLTQQVLGPPPTAGSSGRTGKSGTQSNVQGASLFTAVFLAITPAMLQRSLSGSFDNECLGVPLMLVFFREWLLALRTVSPWQCVRSGLAGFLLASTWGGYAVALNTVAAHVTILCIFAAVTNYERIAIRTSDGSDVAPTSTVTQRVYVAYSVTYVTATSLSIALVPYHTAETGVLGFLLSFENAAPFAVFLFLQVITLMQILLRHPASSSTSQAQKWFSVAAVVASVGVLVLGVVRGGRQSWILGFANKFAADPLAASLGDVKPLAWGSLFLDFHVLLLLFPAGVLSLLRKPTDGSLFMLCAVGISLAAGAAVSRLAPLFIGPPVCIVAGIATSEFLHGNFAAYYQKASSASKQNHKVIERAEELRKHRRELSVVLITACGCLLAFFVFHCTWAAGSISTPSVFLTATESDGSITVYDDYREAYAWLAANTSTDARVLSWWDYGYHISSMANRTTFVDGHTGNQTHIARIGEILCSPEHLAIEKLRQLEVDYVLVVFGGAVSYRSDDINKLLWMLRVVEQTLPESGISEDAFLTHRDSPTKPGRKKKDSTLDQELVGGALKVNSRAPETLFESVIYKLSYYRFGRAKTVAGKPEGWDTVRQAEIGRKHFELKHFEEVYKSPRWLVRIYKVKDPDNLVESSAPRSL